MPEGATATDLVLTITERLRKHGVVGKFVEFFGTGLGQPDHCRSRHARQHVSRVRGDDCDLPDRRDDARLPAPLRSRGVAGGAGRGVRARAGVVQECRGSGSGLYGGDRARPRLGRTVPRRPEAAAGSCVAQAGEERISVRARRHAGSASSRPAETPSTIRRQVDDDRRGRRRRCRPAGGATRAASCRRRRRGDRRDYELHEYLESERDDRRRPAGEEGGRARPDAASRG